MTWTDMPLAAFDIESTGPNPMFTRIVTACVARIDGKDTNARNWLLYPEMDIPEGATKVHGVTTQHAKEHGQEYADGYNEIREALTTAWAEGRIICAYNASFDFTVIDREGRRLGYEPLVAGPIFDPFVIDRAIDKYRKGKRTLGVTCEYYGIGLDNAHTADADALAAARLAWVLGRRNSGLAQLSIEELMAQQADWHHQRQTDFANYLRREGKDASDVNADWPIRIEGAA
jgi:DNA polymerase-3 subunit epsilon